MVKKSESNLNPKTKMLKEGQAGSSSGGGVANSGQPSNQHEESKGILLTESEITQTPKKDLNQDSLALREGSQFSFEQIKAN